MVLPLKKALVKRPDASFLVEDINQWHYTAKPDLPAAQLEHDLFVATLKTAGVEVFYHEDGGASLADSIFAHDPVLQTDKGAIILRMGKSLRRGEEAAIEKSLTKLGIPILYRLHGEATAEGGDMIWLDETTLAVGRGYRTNDEGIRQLQEALHPLGAEVVSYQLPYFYGPEACLHLQSLISFVKENLAVVYLPLMPVPLVEYLQQQQITLIQVPQHEFEKTMGTNVLALGNNKCLMLEGNTQTIDELKKGGVEVYVYKGDEISLKAEGGATCLVRPIHRAK